MNVAAASAFIRASGLLISPFVIIVPVHRSQTRGVRSFSHSLLLVLLCDPQCMRVAHLLRPKDPSRTPPSTAPPSLLSTVSLPYASPLTTFFGGPPFVVFVYLAVAIHRRCHWRSSTGRHAHTLKQTPTFHCHRLRLTRAEFLRIFYLSAELLAPAACAGTYASLGN